MKGFILAFVILVSSLGCSQQEACVVVPPVIPEERPSVNIPLSMRQSNWFGNQHEGSCVHATLVSLLRWQGREGMADYWRQTHGNGEYPESFAGQLEDAGLRYAYVTNGDVKFLEWACSTRRGCGITVMGGAHMVALVHLDLDDGDPETTEWAAILDNNDTSTFYWVKRDELIKEWFRSYGWAVAPVYTPSAPLPR